MPGPFSGECRRKLEKEDTESPKEFHEYVKDYVDGWLLLFFRVEDGVIQYVLERPIM